MKFENDVENQYENFHKKVESVNENASGEYLVRAFGQIFEELQEEKINLEEEMPKNNDYLVDEPLKEIDQLISEV